MQYVATGAGIGVMFSVLPLIVAIVRLSWTIPVRSSELPVIPIVLVYILTGAWGGLVAALLGRYSRYRLVVAGIGLVALPAALAMSVLIRGLPWTAAHWLLAGVGCLLGLVVAFGVKAELS
ncbi:MAG TPA: hypothetical protein VFZ73_05340 [Gemmatimonadaceae bacterium]